MQISIDLKLDSFLVFVSWVSSIPFDELLPINMLILVLMKTNLSLKTFKAYG